MTQQHASSVTLAVIGGGAGSRMGGPKHALQIEGRPILEHLADRLSWPGPTMLVLGAENKVAAAGQERFGRIMHDETPAQGPLFGILAALGASTTDRLVAIPLDMPALGREHLEWLIDRAGAGQYSCAMFRRRLGEAWVIEPFPIVVDRSAADSIRRACAAGVAAVRSLAGMPGAVVLDAPETWRAATWSNLNTPEDLAEYGRATNTMGRPAIAWGGRPGEP